MPRREHQQTKRLIQQRQEQQRARPTSTAKTSGGGLGGQQRQGMTATWAQVASSTPDPYSALVECLTPTGQPQPAASIPFPAPVATQPAPALSPAVPSLPEVRARLDAELAPLPRQVTGPLTVDEEEALDLLHALIDRIPHAQLECRVELLAQAARAAVRAIREAQ